MQAIQDVSIACKQATSNQPTQLERDLESATLRAHFRRPRSRYSVGVMPVQRTNARENTTALW